MDEELEQAYQHHLEMLKEYGLPPQTKEQFIKELKNEERYKELESIVIHSNSLEEKKKAVEEVRAMGDENLLMSIERVFDEQVYHPRYAHQQN